MVNFLYLYHLTNYTYSNRVYLITAKQISPCLSFTLFSIFSCKTHETINLKKLLERFLLCSVRHFLDTKQTALALFCFVSRQILISTARLYACFPLIDACLIAPREAAKNSCSSEERTRAQFRAEFCVCWRKNAETRSRDDSKLKCLAKTVQSSARVQQRE